MKVVSDLLDLTVIVPSYNTRNLLRNCLKSIYDSTHHISFEVICIDDNSKDDSADMVAQEFPQVQLIQNSTSRFYAANNNLGLARSRARYAVLLNSDVIVKPGTFEHLVSFMNAHPDAAAASPKLVNPDGSNQHFIRDFTSLAVMVLQSLNWHKMFPNSKLINRYYNTDFDYSKVQTVASMGTTAFVIRRETWETAGMLDERFPHHFVDLAYCYTLKERGLKVYYTPGAEIIHFGSQSINQDSRNQIHKQHEALRRFYDFYYGKDVSKIEKSIVHFGIQLRYYLKLLEHTISRDKRVIKGPGAPKAAARL